MANLDSGYARSWRGFSGAGSRHHRMTWQLSLQDMNLPRRNGELAFDAPWQGTVFALAVAVIENAFGGDREPFRQQLIAAIAAQPGRPYWESWTAALEALVHSLPTACAPDG